MRGGSPTDEVVEAMTLLAGSRNYAPLVAQLTARIELWPSNPRPFRGRMAFLNVLVDVGLMSRPCLERLLETALLFRQSQPELARRDYQRRLMHRRRARVATMVEIARLNGETIGPKFKLDAHASMIERREAAVAQATDTSWAGRNRASADFWAALDAELDAALQRAREKAQPAESNTHG